MARGRMISRSLSGSERWAALHEVAGDLVEFAQTLYVLLVVHSDDFGIQQGDLHTVHTTVYPSSRRSRADFDTGLQLLQQVQLVNRYEVSGKKFLAINRFEEHQTGLHKRTRSRFPDVSGKFPEIPGKGRSEAIPGNSRKFPANRTERNGTEQNVPSTSRGTARSPQPAKAREEPPARARRRRPLVDRPDITFAALCAVARTLVQRRPALRDDQVEWREAIKDHVVKDGFQSPTSAVVHRAMDAREHVDHARDNGFSSTKGLAGALASARSSKALARAARNLGGKR